MVKPFKSSIMQILVRNMYDSSQSYFFSNDNPELTLTYFKARLSYASCYVFVKENVTVMDFFGNYCSL